MIGSHEFARGLEAELEAVGVHGYRVVGCIDPEHACGEDEVAGIRCLGSLTELRGTIIQQRDRAPRARSAEPGLEGALRGAVSGRRGLKAGGLRAGRRRLPGSTRIDDRSRAALRGAIRPRPARHHHLSVVPVPAAPALPRELADLQADTRPHARHDRGDHRGPLRAGGGARDQGDRPRPGAAPPAADGRGRAGDDLVEAADDAGSRRRPDVDRRRGRPHHPQSGASCDARTSTSCRRSGWC